jgi:predicted Zn-dependent protease
MRRTTWGQSSFLFALLGVVVAFSGCRSAPITGRKQLLLLPEGQEIAMGVSAYEEVLAEEQPSSNQQYIDVVTRVGHRIARVANRPDYEWQFRVVASPEQNAFALPGGKVAIYEGILPICANEAGVAVVMSHEVAHALARHGGERMSQGIALHGVESTLGYLMRNQEKVRRDRVLHAYGITSKYGFILPYSRKHELEADHMGLVLMAQAGYDPREAPRFWQRFAASHGGQSPPEFLSTHPADERRANELENLLADALSHYQQAPERFGLGETLVILPPAQLAQSARPASPSPADVRPSDFEAPARTGLGAAVR